MDKVMRSPLFYAVLLLVLGLHHANAGPLHSAAGRGDLVQIKRLLEQGIALNQTDGYGFTALLIADLNSHDQVVDLLKARGADNSLTALVTRIQFYLNHLGFYAGSLDGELGGASRRAIRKFQRQEGFKSNGRVYQSWVIRLHRNMLARLQSQLQQLGFYAGKIDGINRADSHDAISAYQAQAGFTASGIIEPDWVVHLQQALAILEVEASKAAPSSQPVSPSKTTTSTTQTLPESSPSSESVGVEKIRQLQTALTALGFAAGANDGQLGPATTQAIRAFQQQYKLSSTGLADSEFQQRLERALIRATQKKLRSLGHKLGPADGKLETNTESAIRAYQKQSQLAISGRVSGALLSALNTSIQQSASQKTQPLSAQQLKRIQTQLRKLGYQPGPADGRSGKKTEQAIRAYQKKAKLAVSGDASIELLDHLQAAITTIEIREAQTRLKALGHYRGSIDAELGPNTRKAIRQFQRQQNLSVSGKIDAELLARLKTTAAPATTSLSATEIKLIQHQLNRLGYSVGKADGQLGSRTEKAIRRYQKSQAMSVTGQATSQLLARLSGTSTRVKQSRRINSGGKKTSSGNTQVRGRLRFQRAASGAVLSCSIQGIQLDKTWCTPFSARKNTANCKVVLRPNSEVMFVTCS